MKKYIKPEIVCVKIGGESMMVALSDSDAWGPACTKRYDADLGIDDDDYADDAAASDGLW